MNVMLARVIGSTALFLAGALSTSACATQRELIDRSASAGVSPCSFWPPAHGSALAIAARPQRAATEHLGGVAQRVRSELQRAGYPELRWYPIGLGYRHGFAVTTRLEALNDDGTRKPRTERWSVFYPEPANLRFLTLAQSMPLPHPGRYRVFLVAVTDLPIGASRIAPTWDETTVMDGPGVRSVAHSAFPRENASDLSDYRVGVYIYQYQRRQDEAQGHASANDSDPTATAQLRAVNLTQLAESPFVDAR